MFTHSQVQNGVQEAGFAKNGRSFAGELLECHCAPSNCLSSSRSPHIQALCIQWIISPKFRPAFVFSVQLSAKGTKHSELCSLVLFDFAEASH